jgi:hypothetical protein
MIQATRSALGPMAKEGVSTGLLEMFGPSGDVQLDALELEPAYTNRIESVSMRVATVARADTSACDVLE